MEVLIRTVVVVEDGKEIVAREDCHMTVQVLTGVIVIPECIEMVCFIFKFLEMTIRYEKIGTLWVGEKGCRFKSSGESGNLFVEAMVDSIMAGWEQVSCLAVYQV